MRPKLELEGDAASAGVDEKRRAFLRRSGKTAAALLSAPSLQVLAAHAAWRAQSDGTGGRQGPHAGGYRPLRAITDASGRRILALPEGFDLTTFGVLGERFVSGGGLHPRNADGMAAFARSDGIVRLIRNHELRNNPGDFKGGIVGEVATRYDALAMGGTISIDYDPRMRRVVREGVSLNGTMVNCSGGLAYRDAGWLTCEETITGRHAGWARPHGYTFFVPADRETAEPAQPIRAMGRFTKEAAVADAATGVVYQTEDAGSASGFYRFLPRDPADLGRGGTLQMLKVVGHAQYDARERQRVGLDLRVEWVTIPEPDPDLESGAPSCFAQGYARGGARFHRLEGTHRGERGSVFFVSTTGGDAKSGAPDREGFRPGYGQLWCYTPQGDRGLLTLEYESPSGALLDSPDNLCVSPRGGILLCEDDATADGDAHPLAPGRREVNRLIGLARSGEPFTFAVNLLNASEFAGACFSPDGDILFVNIFGDGTAGSGMTCAITGPWHEGPL